MDRIDHLRVFVRIAACRSFAQAADQLGLPRASVSLALQQLEARLGVRLLNRTTRRVGPLAASSLVARPLGAIELINCASPAYLARRGTPRGPQDLAAHEVVDYVSPTSGRSAPWEWVEDGELRIAVLRSRVSANNAETYIACALAGLGLIQIPAYDVQHHLRAGELVALMPEAKALPMPVHLVYPHRKHLSRRLQAFMLWLQALMGPHLQGPAGPAPLPQSPPSGT